MAADNQTLIQLRAKRQELEDAIAYHEAKTAEARADLVHVHVVIQMFEAGPQEGRRFPNYVNLSRVFAKGELFDLATAAMAANGGSMNSREIGATIIREKGWDTNDRTLQQGVTRRVVHMLNKALRRGKIGSPGYEKGVRVWQLSS